MAETTDLTVARRHVEVNVGFGRGFTWLDRVTDEDYAGREGMP